MTISHLLKDYANRFYGTASFGFIKSGEECVIKAEEFYQHVKKAEHFFRQNMGERKKQRIAVVGENSYAYLVMIFGIICSENIVVPLNHTYADDVLCQFLEKAAVSKVICDEEYITGLTEKNLEIPILSMGESFEKILEQPESIGEESGGAAEDVILMLLSSGTSGISKIVEITNENLCAFPRRVLEWEQESPQNSLLLLPFYHISGIIPLLEDMMRGNLTYISNAKYLIRDIQQYHIDKLILVPAMMKRVLGQCEKSEEFKGACNSIKEALCLGAPMDGDLIQRMENASITPKTYYGMTETTGTVSGEGTYKKGACGKVAPFCEVKIQDGEILVKGRNVMKGYFNDAEETAKVLEEGWLHTGDLGEIDEEGYLFVKGRRKNTIILSNGENVCPEELENDLYRCELVEECRVFGQDDAVKAEVFCGGEKKREDAEQIIKEHVRVMNRSLPPSHKIKEIQFSNHPLEKNSMGKIIRR